MPAQRIDVQEPLKFSVAEIGLVNKRRLLGCFGFLIFLLI